MNKNFIFFGILASILIGSSFGLFSIENSFAEEDFSKIQEDSKAYQKQLDKQEKENKKADEQKQKLEDKKENKKADEQKQKLEDKQENKKANEQKQKLEDKKTKLDSDRKKLEEKLSKKINKYEEKLKEIKIKYQNKIESGFTGDVEKFSDKSAKLEDKIAKKSDQIRKKLLEKQEKLDSRTQKILDKINNGDYLGDKISTSNSFEIYELRFDSVTLSGIHNKTQLSTLEGSMIFNTFDKSKSNLKLELEECGITVDGIPFNCGFGKARTTSSGDSGLKDSLVVLAFLEDDVLAEVYSTLKISLNADSPIGEITDSTQVSILNPQSKISGMWFLDGTGTLTKTVSTTDDTTGNEISVKLTEDLAITGN